MQESKTAGGMLKGTHYLFQFIGKGAQFRVYAMLTKEGKTTGRVLKVPLTLAETEQVIKPHVFGDELLPYQTVEQSVRKIAKNLILRRQTIPKIIEGANGEHDLLMHAIGDLRVLPKTVAHHDDTLGVTLPVFCTQNQAAPISEFLDLFRFAELYPERLTKKHILKIETVFDQIGRLHLLLWEYGFFERSFNLRNIGISDEELPHVVLLDVGELITDTAQAAERFKNRPWEYNTVVNKEDYTFVPTVLHRLYKQMCDEHFSSKAFNQHWQRRKKEYEALYLTTLREQEIRSVDPTEQVHLWVKRQTFEEVLYRGMNPARIDQALLTRDDFLLLQNDVRPMDSLPDSSVELAERRRSDSVWEPERMW